MKVLVRLNRGFDKQVKVLGTDLTDDQIKDYIIDVLGDALGVDDENYANYHLPEKWASNTTLHRNGDTYSIKTPSGDGRMQYNLDFGDDKIFMVITIDKVPTTKIPTTKITKDNYLFSVLEENQATVTTTDGVKTIITLEQYNKLEKDLATIPLYSYLGGYATSKAVRVDKELCEATTFDKSTIEVDGWTTEWHTSKTMAVHSLIYIKGLELTSINNDAQSHLAILQEDYEDPDATDASKQRIDRVMDKYKKDVEKAEANLDLAKDLLSDI